MFFPPTLGCTPNPPLRQKVRQVAGEGLEQLLRRNGHEGMCEFPLPNRCNCDALNISHLGGKLSLSVEGVQVSDHDVSRLLELDALGRLVNRVQGLLLHGGVKGHSSLAAVGKPAALCRWRRLAVQLAVTRRLER